MKKLLSVFLISVMILTLAAPVFADDGEGPVVSDMTVVGSVYDAKNGRHILALSFKESHYATYDGEYHWYYTTSNIYVNNDRLSMFSSDGSKTGDAVLEAAKNHELIPVGTVVEVTWSGMIQEIYPPVLSDITDIRFTDKKTDYSIEEISQEAAAMNEMRTDNLYDLPVQVSQPKEANMKSVTSDFTVLFSRAFERDGKTYHSFLIGQKTRFGLENYGFVSTVDVELSSDGSSFGDRMLKAAQSGGEILSGAVIELTWNGDIQETFPVGFPLVTAIRFTGKMTSATEEETKRVLDEFNEFYETDEYRLTENHGGLFATDPIPFTVIYSETGKNGAFTLYLVQKRSYTDSQGNESHTNDFIRYTVEGHVKVASDGSEAAEAALAKYTAGERIPTGTVAEVVWNGMVMDTYPQQIGDVRSITFTSAESEYTADEIQQLYDGYNDEFDLSDSGLSFEDGYGNQSDIAPDAASNSESNPKTGTAPAAAIVLAGMAAYAAALRFYKKH